ncbi:cellulase family glycosylhydrolase [Fulvivirgaceae bacterium PWU4]|uniref:Cellulase family glycosylhydrolase n=1 Tax=Chryseosolibacter histidini TaxID=2782349 RepID=A0AAP2DH50_9BACT|nr:cellulase family glycosylhydrolase [Chryseosolibacter histidini]MBT1695308.1 cellulase family glycosylhydrolase [Chryseosolibacter histidini]
MKKINLRKHFNTSFGRKTVTVIMAMLVWLGAGDRCFGQYLHTQGKQIVDGQGREVILRGMGLGGWMLQEGYMLETSSFANSQYQIRAKIEDLIGESNTNAFYDAWLANHCTKRDIDSLAAWGFNSVRLPMHYNLFTLPVEKEPVAGQNTWLDKGFTMVDNLLKWCAANKIYLILDLHAAPGGQGNDAAISDYDKTKPSLWQNEENQQKTVALWRKLAERYANEPWMGGYDLINETNWNFTPDGHKNGCGETNNAPLRKLFTDITTAIRQVDKHHIIYIEGNCWANNHTGLWPASDNNLVLSFHKYWNNNDQASLQGMLSLRDQYNVPLWLGESGENSNVWFRNAIGLMEENKIGWAWWPMKKIASVVNPLTVVKNDGYAQLLNYWKNGGTRPTAEFAQKALMQLAENLKIENNIYRKDVIDAMFRQVRDASTTLPFKKHVVPGIVQAADYDLGRVNKAYFDTDTANYRVTTGNFAAWNNGWNYRNDGVDIQASSDTDTNGNGYNIGWTADGEWLQYTVNVESSATYEITVRYAAVADGAKIKLVVDGADASAVTALPASGGNQTWTSKTIPDVALRKGVRKIRLVFEKGGANIGYLKFALSKRRTP